MTRRAFHPDPVEAPPAVVVDLPAFRGCTHPTRLALVREVDDRARDSSGYLCDELVAGERIALALGDLVVAVGSAQQGDAIVSTARLYCVDPDGNLILFAYCRSNGWASKLRDLVATFLRYHPIRRPIEALSHLAGETRGRALVATTDAARAEGLAEAAGLDERARVLAERLIPGLEFIRDLPADSPGIARPDGDDDEGRDLAAELGRYTLAQLRAEVTRRLARGER